MAEPAVVLIPKCIECGETWLPQDTDHWQAYWIENGPEELLLFYCVECAKREFGGRA
jgi:hypothetical protein